MNWFAFAAWACMTAHILYQAWVIRVQRERLEELVRLIRARQEGPPLRGFSDVSKGLSDIALTRMVETTEDVPARRM